MPALLELGHVGLSYHTLSGEIRSTLTISFFRSGGESLLWVGTYGCEKRVNPESDSRTSDTEQGQITMQGTSRRNILFSYPDICCRRIIFSNG